MREIKYVDALNEALREEMLNDESVFIIGEDIGKNGGVFGVTKNLWEEFGDRRVRNTPISEAAFVGCGLGAAVTGLRPVVELMYQDFAMVCMDQIVNQTAKIRYMFGGKAKVPMVIRMQGGAGAGDAAQHSQSLEALFTHIPGLKVVMPSTPYDAKGLLKASIKEDNPVIFIEHQMLYNTTGEVPEEEYAIELGKADVKKDGADATVVSWSYELQMVLRAAIELMDEGINVEVIDPRTLNPLDIDTILKSVEKTRKLLVVHQACKTGGYAGEIIAQVIEKGFYYLDAPIMRLGASDTPVPYNEYLESLHYPSVEKIKEAIRELIQE
ncbi:MAG: alpha-ketoacid dehydrogenase subunit beta [Sedimentibacter sp.]|uniref:alpha-ketoacid dehydrogenase subunit beta n=1 Tax=Sedimentibacter sp. TaxID=1960295 RepID=UPI003159670D